MGDDIMAGHREDARRGWAYPVESNFLAVGDEAGVGTPEICKRQEEDEDEEEEEEEEEE
eukprot:gene4681-855_t